MASVQMWPGLLIHQVLGDGLGLVAVLDTVALGCITFMAVGPTHTDIRTGTGLMGIDHTDMDDMGGTEVDMESCPLCAIGEGN